ncbi:MAG TPA: hypothetical protein PLF81_18590 [Candidatus Anammoximicrobium sp.]|nr:hypothetical protein [Candidatus Anammoximicrobium sp.]
MLTTEQLQALADGEASKMYSPQMARELHARLARAGALGEIAWQLRLAAREKWERGYCLRRTDLEKQLKKDDCGLNWGWAEVWTRFGERSSRRAPEPTIVLVIDLPIGQLVLNDDYHTGLRPPEYQGPIEYDALTDLRIAAFVELVLQYRTPAEVCYAIACLAASNDGDEFPDVPVPAPAMFDELDIDTPGETDEALE